MAGLKPEEWEAKDAASLLYHIDNLTNYRPHRSCNLGHLERVMALLEKGARIENKERDSAVRKITKILIHHWSPARKQVADIILFLHDKGADIRGGLLNIARALEYEPPEKPDLYEEPSIEKQTCNKIRLDTAGMLVGLYDRGFKNRELMDRALSSSIGLLEDWSLRERATGLLEQMGKRGWMKEEHVRKLHSLTKHKKRRVKESAERVLLGRR